MIFTSDRLGTTDLWIMPLGEVPSGNASPILVKKGIEFLISARISSKGGFYYWKQLNLSNVYSAEVDWVEHIVKENPSAISASIKADFKQKGQWSPKGNEIAFEVEDDGAKTIQIYSLTEKNVHIVPGLTEWNDWTWSLDGMALNIWGSYKGSKKGIYRIDSNTGERETIRVYPDRDLWFSAAFSSCPEMKKLYNTWNVNETLFQLYTYDFETDTNKVLFENIKSDNDINKYNKFHRSPDGKWLVCFRWADDYIGYLRLFSTDTGEFRDLYKDESWKVDCLEWMPDSRSIVFIDPEGEYSALKFVLWKLDIDNGIPERIWAFEQNVRIGDIQIHPSGNKIIYTKQQQENRFYGLENFLPNM